MKQLNARQQKVLDLIKSHPNGITRKELFAHVYCHFDTLRKDLHEMRDRALVAVSVNGGRHAKWATIDRAPEVSAEHRARIKQRGVDIDPVASERAKRAAVTRKANWAAKAAGLPPPEPIEEPDQSVRTIFPVGTWTTETKTAASWIPL